MTVLIIIGSVLTYMLGMAVTTAVMLSEDSDPDDDDIFEAAAWSLIWPIIAVLTSIGWVGVVAHRKLVAHKERKQLPEAKVVK